MDTTIESISALEILDSRGNPTVEVKVLIYDTATFTRIGEFAAQAPSGIFFTSRAGRTGF